jgi:GWxTD domain-containing protein
MFLFVCTSLAGQALRDINYNYLYNPDAKISFQLKPVKSAEGWTVLYQFELKDSQGNLNEYSLQWESRKALSDKEGAALESAIINETNRTNTSFGGTVTLPAQPSQIITCKITNTVLKVAWLFYVNLEANYPVTNFLTRGGEPVLKPFVTTQQPFSLAKQEAVTVSYYNDQFPPAALIFSEAQARVAKGIKSDSVFSTMSGDSLSFLKKGLYLIQRDTNATEGISFRAEDDYPRYNKIQNLAGPLVYICTKQEYDRLELARGDKQTFDNIILSITGNTERARKLIRNYFKRVELANLYFTSYKEGWKTDRGMVYIIFGIPDDVFKFNDREVWKYKNESFTISFDFVKSTSVFDPGNYVLIREKRFQQTWYEVVDLWRNARF